MHRSLLATRAAIPPFFCNPLFNCLDLVRYNHIQVKGLMAGRSVVSVGINGSGMGAGARQTNKAREERGGSGSGRAGGQAGREEGASTGGAAGGPSSPRLLRGLGFAEARASRYHPNHLC